MSKVAVVYWSGTGNTQAMADLVAEGAKEAGAEVESLYKTIYHGDGSAISLIDKLEDKNREDEEVLDKLTVRRLLRELPPQDARLIIMRYYMDKTQTQVAKELGVSQVQVSRMEKKILGTMRKKF